MPLSNPPIKSEKIRWANFILLFDTKIAYECQIDLGFVELGSSEVDINVSENLFIFSK